VMGTITLLAMLVVVGAFALVQVRRAERLAVDQAVLAQREAERARAAEVRASEQLAALQREQEAKARAEAEVVRGKDDLRAVNHRLEQALEKARIESETATTLASSLQTANEKLSRLLGEERARADRLEKERKKITTELR
jgi:eukaryotic-like serine/threonine-protein kinase